MADLIPFESFVDVLATCQEPEDDPFVRGTCVSRTASAIDSGALVQCQSCNKFVPVRLTQPVEDGVAQHRHWERWCIDCYWDRRYGLR